MARPSDWWVLDLDADPAPGSPERVEQLSERLLSFAEKARTAQRAVAAMDDDDAASALLGISAERFREQFGDFPAQINKVRASHRMAGQALAAFAPRLRAAQADADRALDEGRNVRIRLDEAVRGVAIAQGPVNAQGADRAQVRQALRDAQAANAAQGDVSSARIALDAAKQLAEHARRLRTEAADMCARAIDDAAGAAIEPRSFWQKLADGFGILWDAICETAKWMTLVVGVIAVAVAGPAGWAVVVAGGALVITGVVAVAEGRRSMQHLVFAILGALPGVRGYTTVGPLGDSYRDGGTTALGASAGAAMRACVTEMLAALRGTATDAPAPDAPAPTLFPYLRWLGAPSPAWRPQPC